MKIGIITAELVFTRPPGRAYGSGIVPAESLPKLEAEREHYRILTKWWYDDDPKTGEKRPAFTPIEQGRLAFIEKQGIGHGDRFLATFEVKEVKRQGKVQRQMWLVDAQPIR